MTHFESATTLFGLETPLLKVDSRCMICSSDLHSQRNRSKDFPPLTIGDCCFREFEQRVFDVAREVVRWYRLRDEWITELLAAHKAELNGNPIDGEMELRVLRGVESFAVFHGGRTCPDEEVCDVCEETLFEADFTYLFGVRCCERCYPRYDLALKSWRRHFIFWYKAELKRHQAHLAKDREQIADLPA